MLINVLKLPEVNLNPLIEARGFALEQLNQVGSGGGDFFVFSQTEKEIVFRNVSSCASFCTKKEKCDVRFCDQRGSEIHRGIAFIDSNLSFVYTGCANLSDPGCEARITLSS